jgi:hypothetical protein
MSQLPAQRGILVYRVRARDANGHIDLWDGNGCKKDCHPDFAKYCYSMAIWKAE